MIFLVEDDADTRDAICLLLDCEALPVRGFPSCSALRQTVDPKAADCLVLDVHMQGMSGIELLERVRKDGGRLPVILMTGHLTAAIRDRAIAAGAFAVLEKPFDGSQLVETILRAIAPRG